MKRYYCYLTFISHSKPKPCHVKRRLMLVTSIFFLFLHHNVSCTINNNFHNLSHIYHFLTHSPIHHFETILNSKKLQTTTEIWLLKDFKIQITLTTLRKKMKLLNFINFTFFHYVFLQLFSSMC